MKKKYIIALEDRNVWSCGVPAKTLLLSDVSIFGTDLSSVNTGIELTPYTEPDLEQVRKEAYERGHENGYSIGYDEGREAGIQAGMCDAWEAARKIIHMPEADLLNLFTECYSAVCTSVQVFLKYDASEAIEKIRQYEQEKEEIKVGDEVEGDEGGQRGVVIDSRFENSQVAVLTGNSKVYSWWSKCAIHKTGRHFPEIAVVLEKIREV